APRETTKLTLEVSNVDSTAAVLGAQVNAVKGRIVKADISHERSGRVVGHLVYDVPLTSAATIIEQFKGAGTVRVQETAHDDQASDGKYALARIDVVLSNTELIIPKDDGLWAQVRKGLSVSVQFLLLSLSWVIFILFVILPWALVGYGIYRLGRRLF